MPTPLPRCLPTRPSIDALQCGDLDEHVVLLHSVRVGRGWPALGLGLVDAAVAPPILVDLVEAAGARLEAVLVRALSHRR